MSIEDKLTVTFDTDHLRQRLEQRLREIGKSARGASREAGLGESTIRNIMEGKSKAPRLNTIVQLASVLDVHLSWFLESSVHSKDEIGKKTTTKIDLLSIAKVLPDRPELDHSKELIGLYYPIIKADGSYLIEYPSNMYTNAPDLPKPVKFRQYVFLARNDRMWPVFRKDDQLLIDPDLPIIQDEDYLFRHSETRETTTARLARLAAFDDDAFHILSFNPKESFELPRANWKAHGVRLRIPIGGTWSRSN